MFFVFVPTLLTKNPPPASLDLSFDMGIGGLSVGVVSSTGGEIQKVSGGGGAAEFVVSASSPAPGKRDGEGGGGDPAMSPGAAGKLAGSCMALY